MVRSSNQATPFQQRLDYVGGMSGDMPSSFFWYPAPFLIQVTLKKKAFSKKAKIKGQRMLKVYIYIRIFNFNCVRFIWPFDVPPPGVRAFLVFFQRAKSRRSVVCSHEQWQQSPLVTFKHTMLVNRHAYNGLSQSPYNWEGIQRYDPRHNLNNKEQAGVLFFNMS